MPSRLVANFFRVLPVGLVVAILPFAPGLLAQLPTQKLPDLPAPIQAPEALLAPSPGEDLAIPAPSVSPSSPITSSTSSSKQFVVHGADLKTRSVFCMLADEAADSLRRLLKDNNPERLPVVIVLKTAAEAKRTGQAVTTNISQLAHGGFHFQLTVNLRQGFQISEFNHELVRTLLAERILRNHKQLQSTRERILPDWLLTGVSQALSYKERANPSLLFAAVFRSGRVYSIDAILQANPNQLDALSKGIYETSSCALVLTLLDQPDGSQRFARFLSSLVTDTKSDRELLQQHFPGLGASDNSLEKWWSLQMATLATPSALETMSVDETERLLSEALTLAYSPVPPKESKSKSQSPTPSRLSHPAGNDHDAGPREDKVEKPSRFHLPFFKNRKKEVLFPFRKRKEDNDQTPSDQAKDDPPQKTENTPAASKPAFQVLPKKPSSQRDISDTPPLSEESSSIQKSTTPSLPSKKGDAKKLSELPELPPSGSLQDEKNEDKKSGANLNPFLWLRKDHSKTDNTQDTEASSVKESNTKNSNRNNSSSDIEVQDQEAPLPPMDFSPASSDEANEILPLPTHAPPSITEQRITAPLGSYENIMKRTDRGAILQPNLDRLNALRQRGHPLYRPLVTQYIEIVKNLMLGKDKGVKDRLAHLEREHQLIYVQAKEVETFVDTYIANHSGLSNTFKDYLDLCDQIEQEIHPRNDPISEYLDTLEKVYQQ